MHMNANICFNGHTCRGQRRMSDNRIYHSPYYSPEEGSSSEPEAYHFDWVAGDSMIYPSAPYHCGYRHI